MKISFLALSLVFFSLTFANNNSQPQQILPSSDVLNEAIKHNDNLNKVEVPPKSHKLKNIDLDKITTKVRESLPNKNLRPFAEYENAGFVLFTSDFNFDSANVKMTILKTLPKDVFAVVLTESNVNSQRKTLEQYISPDRLIVLNISAGFWARDNLPIPVIDETDNKNTLALVDAKYYYNFEPDKELSDYFNVPLIKHSYYYEGGNFMADAKGNCFLVNANTGEKLPDLILSTDYGCHTITRLPFIDGIGHVDERLKILSDTDILTDTPKYKEILEKKGYKVTMLPKPSKPYETYSNALLVNGNLYLPIYDESTDQVAIDVYKSFGLNVIPLNTSSLSNDGLGSIHCITMSYPKTTLIHSFNYNYKNLRIEPKNQEEYLFIKAIFDGYNDYIYQDLIKGKIPVDLFFDAIGNNNEEIKLSPAMLAIISKQTAILNTLFNFGANIDILSSEGKTLMDYSIEYFNKDAIQILNLKGKTINDKNNLGETPLFRAAKENKEDSVKFLLDNFADPNIKDNSGRTPFQVAKDEKIKLMLKLAENGDWGKTPNTSKTFWSSLFDSSNPAITPEVKECIEGCIKTDNLSYESCKELCLLHSDYYN